MPETSSVSVIPPAVAETEVNQEEITPQDSQNLLNVPGSKPGSNEDIRGRRSRSGSTKRVTIADPPVAGSQSPPRSPAGDPATRSRTDKQTKLVSYQRPRFDRSKSRNTRINEAISRPVNPAYTDRKTMENLTSSMKNASELLERRRAQGT